MHLAKSVPNQVTSFTASYFEYRQITLNWTAPADNGSAITDYKILYTDEPPLYATNWIEYSRAPDTSTNFIVTGLTNGTPYTFKVAAVNEYGLGQYSATDVGYPVSGPESVTAVSATAGNERITLTWTAPLNNGGFAISNYKIGVKPAGGSWSEILTGSTTESATVTGLVNGTAYSIRIIAINSEGDGDTFLLPNTVTPITFPGEPINLTAIHSNERVVLSWDIPSTDGGSPITDYRVEYSSNSGSSWSTITRTPSVLRIETVTALSNGTEYRFRVSAINVVDTGAASSPITATPSTLASAPTNLQVTPSNQSVSISFTVGNSGGAAISDYIIEYSTDAGSTWSTHTHTSDATSPISITGLTNYLNYRFRLSPVNLNGTGSTSTTTSVSMPFGALTSMSFTRNSVGTAAGAVFSTQPQITLRDQNSETIQTDSSTVVTATISVGGSLVGSTTATAIAGVVTFSNLGISGTAGTSYMITYSTSGATSVTQSVTVTAGVASKLRISRSSAGAQTGTPFTTQPIILVVDAGNNTISSHPNTKITASLDNSNCFFATSTETASALSGSATFSGLGIISASGTQCLITYSALSLTSVLETITVTSGPAASISRRTRPDSGYYGRAFGQQPVYVITDIGGNAVTTDNTTVLTVTTPNNGGSTIFQESMTAVNGVVTFTGLGFSGINSGTFVLFRVSTTTFPNYYTDSVMIVKGDPVLTWGDSTKLSGASAYTVTAPTSNAAGTFVYSSSNTGVASVSGSTITVVGQGTTTLTATLTPTDTANFNSNVSVTSTLTVTAGAATISISLAGGVVTVAKGTAINITASVNTAGKVKFMVNGKVIGGCAAKSATTSATCSWKPAIQGQSVALTALLNPTSSSFSNVRSSALNVGVGRRTGRR